MMPNHQLWMRSVMHATARSLQLVVLTGVPVVIRHVECIQSITYTRP